MNLHDVNDKFMIGLVQARNFLHRELDALCRKNGLTLPQFTVMRVLYSRGDMCVKDIQKALSSTPGNILVVINNMAKQGWITKTPSKADKRFSMVSLTPKGQELTAVVYPQHETLLNRLLDRYTVKEKEQLAELLDRFAGNK